MFVRIDTTSGIPIRQQITDQIKHMIAAETVLVGDRLPTVRELALELRVNPNTVARAYQDLEQEDVVETRRGLGTFARLPGSRLDADERRRIVARNIDGALVEAIHLGIDADQVREIIDERIALLYERETAPLRTPILPRRRAADSP